MLAAHGGVRHAMDLPRQLRRVEEEILQRAVLHAVLTPHLLHEELRVGDHLELVDADLDCSLEARDERRVLGDVVRRDPDRLTTGVEDRPVLRLQDERVRRRSGVAPRSSVREELRLHASTSG